MTHFSIVGQWLHSEKEVVGFYNIGDLIKFWGKNGAFWGGLWSLFFGGIFLTLPVIGPVMVPRSSRRYGRAEWTFKIVTG